MPETGNEGCGLPTASEALPSILGMDFISAFRLTVSVLEHRVELEPISVA